MKPRQTVFEFADAELIYRAARVGIRALSRSEQRRAEVALKRLKAIQDNLKNAEEFILVLVKENEIRNQSLSELRQQLSPETWKNYTINK